MVDAAKGLGTRTAEARRRAGLTQEALAEKTRLNIKTIRGIEQGRSDPEIATLRRLARTLGVAVADLIGDEPSVTSRKLRRLHDELGELSPEVIAAIATLVHELRANRTRASTRVRSGRR
jgi:transcriptional regulator with XRE-family HTH domain